MQGVVRKVQVLAHPIVIVEGFGLKVLVRALLARRGETFLEVVSRCAEEEAHQGEEHLDLSRTVKRFIGYECLARDIYRALAQGLAAVPDAARFFGTLSRHEEGHAIVLSRVRREIRRGHLWKESKAVHLENLEAFEARMSGFLDEARRGVPLARALEICEAIEGSEINVVFDSLNACVDMRSRARFERFFVFTQHHLSYCEEQVKRLRARV